MNSLFGSASVRAAISLIGAALLLTACGQRGPLYLPDPESISATGAKPAASGERVKQPEAAK